MRHNKKLRISIDKDWHVGDRSMRSSVYFIDRGIPLESDTLNWNVGSSELTVAIKLCSSNDCGNMSYRESYVFDCHLFSVALRQICHETMAFRITLLNLVSKSTNK